MCNGSPLTETFYKIDAGEKQTDEIQIIGCVLPQDGDYRLKIDLLDDDFTKLDSKTKKFTLNDYEKLKFKIK